MLEHKLSKFFKKTLKNSVEKFFSGLEMKIAKKMAKSQKFCTKLMSILGPFWKGRQLFKSSPLCFSQKRAFF